MSAARRLSLNQYQASRVDIIEVIKPVYNFKAAEGDVPRKKKAAKSSKSEG